VIPFIFEKGAFSFLLSNGLERLRQICLRLKKKAWLTAELRQLQTFKSLELRLRTSSLGQAAELRQLHTQLGVRARGFIRSRR